MISRCSRSAISLSRPTNCIDRAPIIARSSDSAVNSAIDTDRRELEDVIGSTSRSSRFTGGCSAASAIGIVTASDSGRSLRPWHRGHSVADMYCIMYSR